MVKIKNPILSLGARGLVGAISYVRRRKTNIAEKTPFVADVMTAPQLSWRHMFLKCTALWNALSAAEQAEWESLARPKHMTGYAYWQSQCLRPNPGIYLPLQGGTMSGDIDMDKNRILKLPAPTVAQEADTLTARNIAITAHAAIAAAHHTKYALTIGSYVGNNGVNRAIPHGLGAIPPFVHIWETEQFWFILHTTMGPVISRNGPTSIGFHAVTLKDAVNFYVGNAASFTQSANSAGRGYSWAALP